jgi:uncharacterized membrane protein
MTQTILSWLAGFPPEVAVAILAMIPVTEMQASIPVALTAFDLPVATAIIASYVGNIIPAAVLLAVLPKGLEWTERHVPWLKKIMVRYFHAKEDKFRSAYEKWGAFALFLYVAVPTPFSGVWSGSILATLFHIPRRYSVPVIFIGAFSTAIIVTLIVQGTLGFLSWML